MALIAGEEHGSGAMKRPSDRLIRYSSGAEAATTSSACCAEVQQISRQINSLGEKTGGEKGGAERKGGKDSEETKGEGNESSNQEQGVRGAGGQECEEGGGRQQREDRGGRRAGEENEMETKAEESTSRVHSTPCEGSKRDPARHAGCGRDNGHQNASGEPQICPGR